LILDTASDNDRPSNTHTHTLSLTHTRTGIALSSGFASVYTEKVLKAQRSNTVAKANYSLAYMQVQLALVSLVILGFYAFIMDFEQISQYGMLHNFSTGAFVSVFNSAIGGLVVAAVLKYADSVLKSYATAVSVVMTGVLSMMLFGTKLDSIYFMGIVNVVCAVLLYNGKNMDKYACGG
jgi:UDP-sugar transporter A1/2/3